MDWKERRVDDVVIVDLEEEPSDESVPVPRVVEELLDRGEERIVLNLAAVEYLDSTRVGQLVVGHRRASEAGASLKLAALSSRIRELLELHHLLEILEHYPDVEAAIASFGDDGPTPSGEATVPGDR